MAHYRFFLRATGLLTLILLSACGNNGDMTAEEAVEQFASGLIAEDYRSAYRVTSQEMRQWLGSRETLRDTFGNLCTGSLTEHDLRIEPAGIGYQVGVGTFTCENGKTIPMVIVAEEVTIDRWQVTDYSINPGVGDG
jgi:hypothetical protein